MGTIKKLDDYTPQERKVLDPLYDVIDPELFVNIVDLGLIYNIEVDSEQNILITMTFTTPFCPMGESIIDGVENVLHIEFPDREVHIDLTFDPPWSPERLTNEGKKMLEMS
ncbi:metal-sulfur cluster assembly factor [Membranicola marinus]|uniref:Metal-sulfur cluster assembly factor n=1 Tax=Membranihabitans marinus TaxID=1227546 RepID=A0A953HRA9_9BACT|nr:metal-sulfur cluster assembly factor [Membranihabitans marinus]MBY5959824.1 metal-sulfur cluster assembly factor [Membranihabitans marinus]